MLEVMVAANASVASSAMTTEETSLIIALIQIVLAGVTCMFKTFIPMHALLRKGEGESRTVEASMSHKTPVEG
jgi:hypothetical protein